MRAGRASFTAQVVSFARGLATLSSPVGTPIDDSLARVLLPAPLSTILGAASHTPRGARALRRGLDLATGNIVQHMALRTLAIDEAVRESIVLGARQLVLLGAGLDARAYRLDGLREVTAFEVDHPDTQREKQKRIVGHAPRAQDVRHVPVDFARDSLEHALLDAGHDADVPTCWVWEGVTMYLPKPAMAASLAALSARSAIGSRLAVTYVEGSLSDGSVAASPVTTALLRVLGEPLHGLYQVDEMARVLASESFAVRFDTGSAEWRRRHGVRAPLIRAFDGERLAVAERIGA